jgi:hypothetical protein
MDNNQSVKKRTCKLQTKELTIDTASVFNATMPGYEMMSLSRVSAIEKWLNVSSSK